MNCVSDGLKRAKCAKEVAQPGHAAGPLKCLRHARTHTHTHTHIHTHPHTHTCTHARTDACIRLIPQIFEVFATIFLVLLQPINCSTWGQEAAAAAAGVAGQWSTGPTVCPHQTHLRLERSLQHLEAQQELERQVSKTPPLPVRPA